MDFSNTNRRRIAVLSGDGIGPEVVGSAAAVLNAAAARHDIGLDLVAGLVGGAAIEATGEPLPAATLELCRDSDAVLFGATGAPRWDHLRGGARPGSALLRLRRELGLAVNLRPVRFRQGLAGHAPVRADLAAGTDFIIVRELTGGVYFGEQGRSGAGGAERAFDTMAYTRREIRTAVSYALGLARQRGRRLVSVDKANVLASSRLWREVASAEAGRFPDVQVTHQLVDSFAFFMLCRPTALDVVVTENLFGDILSDEAAAIAGSLGVLGSASLNPGGGPGLYEPVHGSAPDIAGRGIANPIGAIESAALLLEHSLAAPAAARAVRQAVDDVIDAGILPADLGGGATTAEITDAVLSRLGVAVNMGVRA